MNTSPRQIRRIAPLTVVVALATFVSACFLAIPVLIMHSQDGDSYVATAEVPASARTVYDTAVAMIEARSDRLTLSDPDPAAYSLSVSDATQAAELKAAPTGSDKCTVTVNATVADGEPADSEELALRVIKLLCDELRVKCTESGS